MKLVTLTRDMRPHNAGDTMLVPPEIAARLEAEGAISPNPPDYPPRSAVEPARHESARHEPASHEPARQARQESNTRQAYRTKGGRP